jgi:hypothetical protein
MSRVFFSASSLEGLDFDLLPLEPLLVLLPPEDPDDPLELAFLEEEGEEEGEEDLCEGEEALPPLPAPVSEPLPDVPPTAGVVAAELAPTPGEEPADVPTEITWGGAVVVLGAAARPIKTPTPIASSSTPTPASAVTAEERPSPPLVPPPPGTPPPPAAAVEPAASAGVKRFRNWLRACTWRVPHSKQ